jgi:hypothetical protein
VRGAPGEESQIGVAIMVKVELVGEDNEVAEVLTENKGGAAAPPPPKVHSRQRASRLRCARG